MARYALGVVALAGTGSAVVAAWGERLGEAAVRGALLGVAVAAVGALGGMALLARGLERGPRQFMGALLIGILGRMLLFGAVLIGVGLGWPAGCSLAAMGLSVVASFFVFQGLEVWLVLRRSKGAT
jgi:hypothetical protein